MNAVFTPTVPDEAGHDGAELAHGEERRFRTMGDLAALTLDERGMVRDCSKTAERLFGYLRSELMWRHVSLLLPQLAEGLLVREGKLNPRLAFLCHCGHLFHMHNRQGQLFHGELHLVELNNSGRRTLRLIVNPVDDSNP